MLQFEILYWQCYNENQTIIAIENMDKEKIISKDIFLLLILSIYDVICPNNTSLWQFLLASIEQVWRQNDSFNIYFLKNSF